MKQKPYNKDEQRIIIEEIQNSPHNLKQAFEAAARKLKGRKPGSVSGHYYSTLKPLMEREGIIVTQLSTIHGSIANTKTVARKESKQLIVLKHLADRLNSDEQQKLMNHLFDSL